MTDEVDAGNVYLVSERNKTENVMTSYVPQTAITTSATSITTEATQTSRISTATETAVTTSLPETTTSAIVSSQNMQEETAPVLDAQTVTETIAEMTEAEKIIEIPNVSAISVDCLKVTWNAEPDKIYDVTCESVDPEYAYSGNINLIFREENNLCYINGLRENSEYYITVTPVSKEGEQTIPFETVVGKTETVEVIEEFPYEDGWTNCFAYEKAAGLTRMPSSGAIYGSIPDPITGTGIRRDEYGDYCCAMGLFYGTCWDRFLIELENGIQFTVKICDSKGWGDDADGDGIPDGRFHWFGGGKCIVEFIHDGYSPPSGVAFTGSYGYYNWDGLDLGANIRSIKKINYGEFVDY
ncbi:MAG: fibronectin type III [Oscillospiraceae bacterium]